MSKLRQRMIEDMQLRGLAAQNASKPMCVRSGS